MNYITSSTVWGVVHVRLICATQPSKGKLDINKSSRTARVGKG